MNDIEARAVDNIDSHQEAEQSNWSVLAVLKSGVGYTWNYISSEK